MRFLVCVLSTLLILTAAVPVRQKRTSGLSKRDLDMIKMVKNPETYRAMEEEMGFLVPLEALAEDPPAGFENDDVIYGSAAVASLIEMQKVQRVIIGLLKITMVEGSKPTEEELTALAKIFAKTVRKGFTKYQIFDIEGMVMPKETIDVLKEIVANNPLNVTGNNFVGLLKEKLPKIYIVANLYGRLYRHIKKAVDDHDRIKMPEITMEEAGIFKQFWVEFMYTEVVEFFKSDENVIEAFKDFGVLTDTIKTASSYDSLQAFYNGLARSKSLEPYAILVREAGKCFGAELTPKEKTEWNEHFDKALKLAKVLLADGQNITDAEQMAEDFESNDVPVLEKLWNKMKGDEKITEGWQNIRKCLLTEAEHQVYRETLELADAVFTDEQLNAIRQKNEKMYAVLSILNSHVQALRRREGLGTEAAAYLRQAAIPITLLALSENFRLSQATLEKIAARKKTEIERFNNLSADAKKDLVSRFPFHTVLDFSKMD